MPIDASALTPELSTSQLFGHERGAYTSACTRQESPFAMADGGTVFIDEVGDLALAVQPQLLRVIEEKTFKPLGSTRWRKVDFHLVCATRRNLRSMVEEGQFRPDLYYRLGGHAVVLPPLRDRPEDVLPLARHFLKNEIKGTKELPAIEPVVEHCLLQRDYPGNVRDLKQLVSQIAARHVGNGPITSGDIPEDALPEGESAWEGWHDSAFQGVIRRGLGRGLGLKSILQLTGDLAAHIALHETRGNLSRAAAQLGISRRALQQRRAAWRQNGAENDGTEPG